MARANRPRRAAVEEGHRAGGKLAVVGAHRSRAERRISSRCPASLPYIPSIHARASIEATSRKGVRVRREFARARRRSISHHLAKNARILGEGE